MRTLAPLLLVCALLLAGCAPAGEGTLAAREGWITVEPGDAVGQTFVARQAGLNGIDIALRPIDGPARLEFTLSPHPPSGRTLVQGALSVPAGEDADLVRFPFPSPVDSDGRALFFQVNVTGDRPVSVGVARGDAYLDGALHRNGSPGDAQLVFQPAYAPLAAALGRIRRALAWIAPLAAAAILFVVPGWALLALLRPSSVRGPWFSRLALSAGTGMALYPVLFLASDWIGLQPGWWGAWLPPILGAGVLVGRALRPSNRGKEPRPRATAGHRAPDAVAAVVLALVIATRLLPLAELDAPLWGDSVHHSVIVQLLIDSGGLFRDWAPYSELQSFTYHFGFHTLAAAFHWVTGTASPAAVLWTGQLVNVAAVLSLYPLAARWGQSRWAGVAAVLVAGLLSPHPMTYINWGRYTQAAGQALLPVGLYWGWAALDSEETDRGAMALTGLLGAALALTHYRVLAFFALFFPAALAVATWRRRGGRALARLAWMGAGALLVAVPWLIRAFSGQIPALLGAQLSTPANRISAWRTANAVDPATLTEYLPLGVWLAALLAAVWVARRRPGPVATLALWAGLVVLAANPNWLGLPGAGALTNFAVLLAAYIPASLLIGAGVGEAGRLGGPSDRGSKAPTPRAAGSIWLYAMVVAILGLGLWGAAQRLGDVDRRAHALLTRPDLHAAAWIRANTPGDSHFLVDSFFAFHDSLIVGGDGGWWLPLLARRTTTLPPINYATEAGPRLDYRARVNELPDRIASLGIGHPDVLELLQDRGVTHVYVGQRRGAVNNPGPPLLDPEAVLASEGYEPVYHQDRVWIFALR